MLKKILFLSFVLFPCMHAKIFFEFVDNKKNGALDQEFLKKLIDVFNVDIFFETGTYCAETTLNAIPYFEKIITVELSEAFFKGARSKLLPFSKVQIYHDESPNIIKKITPTLKGKVLFWLDAHYSGGDTALSFNDPHAPDAITAIRSELAAIKDAGISDCVILIDDIRGFGSEISGQEYLGCWAYPSLQEVHRDLLKINHNFELALLGDTLLAYDATKNHPVFSQAVVGCTKTRLYDGYNLSDTELIEAENLIKNASPNEKKYIKKLYKDMTDWKDPMFWHDLWYGLVELAEGNYSKAQIAFKKVKKREQHLNKNKQLDRKIIFYDHWRIDQYIKECTVIT
ncbi:MAG: hypothetical protein K2X90_04055 [Candidatus Babeliaceae bacterium]|nr:hypothetical protein [Candidatus Babeliaceae bacterium]